MKPEKSTAPVALCCLIAIAIAWGLKRHYSMAGPRDLRWILGPTAGLVEILSGHPFYFDPDVGHINPDLGIIIAPACAGVNFLIALFSLGAFSGIFRFSRFMTRCLWLPACLLWAVFATIGVNAFRIWISIFLITADFHWGWLSPHRVHRMAGIVIYFFFLCVFYPIIQKVILEIADGGAATSSLRSPMEIRRKHPRTSAAIILWPLFCYWIICIGVPVLNAAFQKNPAGFAEHSLTVAALSLLMAAAFLITRRFIQNPKTIPHETPNSDHRRRAGHRGHHPVRS